MEINGGIVIRNDVNANAMGGTEMMAERLAKEIDPSLLKEFQIVHSRVRSLDNTKLRVFVAHDLPGDPESNFLENGGWKKFHKLVFVSNWQMQEYIRTYNIPWSHCVVMQNAIDPFPQHKKPEDTLRLAYWSTPHRGLNILVPVFEKLAEKYDNIELDVYSSFKLYGWEQRDSSYEDLFNMCKKHPRINYYGTVPNNIIRENLLKTHILAYPSTWPETSCIVLMEAMAAGLLCVHSNLAALYETSANWSAMYQYNEDLSLHASIFYHVLSNAIEAYWTDSVQTRIQSQKTYSEIFYNWEYRKSQWEALLKSLLDLPRELPTETYTNSEEFYYKVGD